MDTKIVRYVVESDGHIHVLIPYKLYREVLWFIRGNRLQATADEVVADAVGAYMRDGLARGTEV